MSATVTDIVARPLKTARGSIARGFAALPVEDPASPVAALRIDRTGGDKGAGLIRGFAVCTVGEALGHDHWCDLVFLNQIAERGNAMANGLKARFTHPGLSSDGLGSFLGRAKNFAVEGEVVRADLHFDESAHSAPDGDLADYAMMLAESDPEAFGSSIVFQHDWTAEDDFKLANGGEWKEVDDGYETWKVIVGFQSPDSRNVNHYSHCRLAELRAVDVVDEPAANPDGLFHIPSDTLSQASAFMAYALGMTSEKPQGELAAQINPERARGFAARFLNERGLAIGPKESFMSTETKPADKPQVEQLSADQIRTQVKAELAKYTAKFGAQGAQWYAEGKTLEEAYDLYAAGLKTERDAALNAEKEANEKLAALDRGEPKPVATNPDTKQSSYSDIVAKSIKK